MREFQRRGRKFGDRGSSGGRFGGERRGGFGGGSGGRFGGGGGFGGREGGDRPWGKSFTTMDKPVNEGEEYTVVISEVGSQGDGITRIKNFVVFVPGTAKGDTVRVKITSVRGRHAVAEVIKEGEAKAEGDEDAEEEAEEATEKKGETEEEAEEEAAEEAEEEKAEKEEEIDFAG